MKGSESEAAAEAAEARPSCWGGPLACVDGAGEDDAGGEVIDKAVAELGKVAVDGVLLEADRNIALRLTRIVALRPTRMQGRLWYRCCCRNNTQRGEAHEGEHTEQQSDGALAHGELAVIRGRVTMHALVCRSGMRSCGGMKAWYLLGLRYVCWDSR